MSMTVYQWLDKYGESHTNKINKTIHWICVPTIVWTVFALFASIPLPAVDFLPWPIWSLATPAALYAIFFYTRLSPPLGAGMVLVSAIMLYLVWAVNTALIGTGFPLWGVALIVFFVAWVFQFIGHNIEGAKPSFIDDMKFLLIGPMWLMSFIYRSLGIKY